MLRNLVGFVAGGAGDLGRATVTRLSREGCKIVFCDIMKSDGEKIAEELGESVFFVPANVNDVHELKKAYEVVNKKFGRLNFIVNCAGIATAFKVYNFNKDTCRDPEMLENALKTNVVGLYNVITCGLKLMGKNEPDDQGLRGTIITTSGIESVDGQVGQVAVAASSGAIASMTLPLARDLGEQGIRVVSICPGIMATKLNNFMPDNVKMHIAKCCASPKRLGRADDYSSLVKAILENPYLNAEVIRMDAGLRLYLA